MVINNTNYFYSHKPVHTITKTNHLMREVGDTNALVAELARLLNISEIDDSTLQLCVKLMDQGVDPKKLATAIKNIKKETQAVRS